MSMGGDAPEIEETEYEKEVARIALHKYNQMRPQLQGAEDFYIEEVKDLNSAQQYRTLADNTAVSVGANFDKATTDVTTNLAAQGIDPTSGKYQGTLETVSEESASVQADATNRAQVAQQDTALQGMGGLVAMGEGESAQALSGTLDVANMSSQHARQRAQESLSKQHRKRSTLGFVAGAGYELSNGENP